MSEPQTILVQPHAEVVWAVLQKSDMDEATARLMQQEVPAAAAQKPGLPVILDMTKVIYLPSMGLGSLVNLMRRLKQDGHKLLLVGLQPEVRSILAVTKLDKLFNIHGTMEEAVSHLRGKV